MFSLLFAFDTMFCLKPENVLILFSIIIIWKMQDVILFPVFFSEVVPKLALAKKDLLTTFHCIFEIE